MTIEHFESAMRVHFWGPLYLTLAALPHLRRVRDRSARIVNISSIGRPGGRPAPAALLGQQVRVDGAVERIARRAGEGRHPRHDRPAGADAHRVPYNAWFKGNHRAEFTWFTLLDSMPGLSIDATRAAAKIVHACRYGDPELVITPQAKLAIVADAVAPSLVARSMQLMNWLLPGAGSPLGQEARSGWQSPTRWAPSWLTRLSDRASARNNELPAAG
jgi:NAD(P)-dependent dehydrogenase (short-subunit alcohol dehydrogenase family)